MMPKLSPRDAVRLYQVSRATLMRALSEGKISAEKTDAGHWMLDASELARVYQLRPSQDAVIRTRPDQVNHARPDQTAASDIAELAVRLARAEAALDAERAKVELLQRHLDDVRRMLPPPGDRPRRWWPW